MTKHDSRAEVETEFLFEARVRLAAPHHIGATPEGVRMTVPVAGGRFAGPRLSGEVVPFSGADWSRIRSDGSGALDVRMTLRTDDGALLYVHWHGIMRCAPEHQAYALDFEKPDDPAGADRYYFRTAPRFEVGDERYAWLNGLLCVTRSRTGDGGVIHRVFAVM
ncbi:MAG TPA: DUF3237 domain-containing protein [Kofleriaceae bacterium]|nr:DUF3237 domain-containing protein [Kofleriaceae bacterium]